MSHRHTLRHRLAAAVLGGGLVLAALGVAAAEWPPGPGAQAAQVADLPPGPGAQAADLPPGPNAQVADLPPGPTAA